MIIELIIFLSVLYLVVKQIERGIERKGKEESKKFKDEHPEIPWHRFR